MTESERVAGRLVEAGRATPDQVFRAQADRRDVEQRLAEAREAEDAAARSFNQVLRRPLDAPVDEVPDSLLRFDLTLTENQAIASALARREELPEAGAGIRAAEAGVRLASASFLPSVSLALDYGFQGRDLSFGWDDDFRVLSVAEAQERPQPSDWNVTLGAAALIIPEYPGSDEYRIVPFPMSRVMYCNRLYLGPSTNGFGGAVGAYAIRTKRFGVAAELGLLDSRPADRADALVGTDDRDPVATAGASLSYRAGPVEGLIGGSRGLNDGAGFLGTARLSVTQLLGPLRAAAGVNATFADRRQMRREFGVTEVEAARRRALLDAGDSRLTPDQTIAYRPEGGLRHVGASLSLAYLLSRRWSLVGFSGLDRLSDEAAASPLVRRREQFSAGLGLGYQL